MSVQWRDRFVRRGMMEPEQLVANPLNWRIHPGDQASALEGVLDEVGWVGDVSVQEGSDVVIDGHLRVERAMARGEMVPCSWYDLADGEVATILATYDSISAMAGTDKQKLDELLREVKSGDSRLQSMLSDLAAKSGLDYFGGGEPGDAPEDVEPAMDRAEELRQKWQTNAGQLWIIGRHRLLCGDSTDADDVARLMGDQKAAMVYTDPPYGVDYDGGTKVREKLAGDDNADIYAKFLPMLLGAVEEKAPLYLWHAGLVSMAVLHALDENGWKCRAQIIWNKNLAQFGALTAQYKQKHEPCWYAHQKGVAPYWYGPTNEVTIWDEDRASVNEFHPTQKPPALAKRAMCNSSMRGDIVLDCFLGSGATMVAAEQTGRRCYGIEIEPKYCAVILERMKALGLEGEQLA